MIDWVCRRTPARWRLGSVHSCRHYSALKLQPE